jgi:CheY-like chemotaxis protein
MGSDACVLLVDDEPAFLRVLTAAIRLLGAQPITAIDADSAWDAIQEKKPSLALIDVRLPGSMDGVGLARRIKEDPEFEDVPVLLMSAFDKPNAPPADGFLAKPLSLDDLPRIIGRYINTN